MKTQTAFRIDKDLLDILKIKAKAERRSLNNYIEFVLYKSIGNLPNDETIKAIKEATSGKKLEEIKDIDSFMDSL